MYTKYFGFNEKPFTLTPNPRFIFLSKHHKEAFAHLLYGINTHSGFIELTGEVGTGKTTVLRTLLGQLQDTTYRSALIFSPCLTGVELLRSINSEFGIGSSSQYASELLAELNGFLLAESSAGRTVVLVIDEAQDLHPGVLEQLRLISNLETENDKLIQIVLAGQPELDLLLSRRDLRQLTQRIAVRYRLRSMSMNETCAYIRQRMEVAGETGGVSFSNSAIKWVHLASRGVPRVINTLCDRSLLIAFGDERRRITTVIVLRAIGEILLQSRQRKTVLAMSAIVFCLIAGSLAETYLHWLSRPVFSTSNSTVTDTPRVALSTLDSAKLEREIRSHNKNEQHIQVFNTFANLWSVLPLNSFSEDLDIPDMFKRLAAKRNLRLTQVNGSLDDVIRIGLPFITATKVADDQGAYCFAVTSVQNGVLSISPALFDSTTITKDYFAAVTSGRFYIVWQNFGQIPDTITKGKQRYEILSLQRLLNQAGFFQDATNGIYSNSTIKAVNRFQQSMGIPPDNSLGELTLAALTRFDTTHRIPSLTVKGGR
jgi:general secretion pathway protein A